jgi:predicted negative regulator of RcsB-dependent stress response
VEAIRALTSDVAAPHCAYHLLNKSSSDDGRTGTSGLIVRLFPNDPRVRYEWPVHEQVATSLERAGIPVVDTRIEIIHTGYSSPEVNAAKQARNLRILEKMTQASYEVHPMVWFLKGGALLDLNRFEDALAAYIKCSQTTLPGETVHEASLVRHATCLAELKRFQEILALQPARSEAEWHPELLLLRGQAEISLGDTHKGMAFLHQVFKTPSQSRIPAYDPIRVRIRALMTIASLWEKSSPGRAVALLRLATQSVQSGHEVNLAEVLAIEQA